LEVVPTSWAFGFGNDEAELGADEWSAAVELDRTTTTGELPAIGF
jgi:hypothetical protein